MNNYFSPHAISAIAPIVVVALSGLLAIVADVFSSRRGLPRFLAMAIGVTGCIIAGVMYLNRYVAFGTVAASNAIFNGALIADDLGIVFAGIILVATIFSLMLSHTYQRHVEGAGSTALMVWSASGALLLAFAGDLMMVFLGVEILSLALYALCALSTKERAREAALKYLILSSLASSVMIYGMALLYGCYGSVSLAVLLNVLNNHAVYAVAMGFVLAGFAFKLGLVPFHVWMPDVFEGAPLPVAAFMSVVTKAGVLAVLARLVYAAISAGLVDQLTAPLWAIAAISMIVGNVGALAQVNLKRLLAYSGIAQIGYIVAALAGKTSFGLRYAVFYLAAYLFMNLGVFAVMAMLSKHDEEGANLPAYAGLASRQPGLAAFMSFFLIGLAGLPPTAGFTGKVLLLASNVDAGYAWLSGFLIVGTALSMYAYFKVIRAMYTPLKHDHLVPELRLSFFELFPPLVVASACALATAIGAFAPRIPFNILPRIV